MLRKRWKLSIVIVAACAGLAQSIGILAGRQLSREQTASLDQVPAAIRATLLAQGGSSGELEVETGAGERVYEADIMNRRHADEP